ncbi:hypothetical protein [Nostoc punctiforme]|nr:hypothetical protein [Nostoc punctiforme]
MVNTQPLLLSINSYETFYDRTSILKEGNLHSLGFTEFNHIHS